MLYREDGQFKLMKWKATFTQNGEEVEQFVIAKKDLESFEKMGHISDLKFEEADYEKEVLDRLDDVKEFSEKVFVPVEMYVLEGKLSKELQLETSKRMDELEASLIELIMLNELQGG